MKNQNLNVNIANNVWTYLYLLLCIFLLSTSIRVSTNLAFNGDFWEHSAAINAFQDNIFAPPHPILNIDAAHHLLTPYHFIIAIFGNLLRLEAPVALAVLGPLNLIIYLYGTKTFVDRFSNLKNKDMLCFFLLSLTLFGWGVHVWFFSGFLSARAFSFIAPYPSTLAFGLMLIGICYADKWLKKSSIFHLILFGCSYIFIGLTHQITFVMMSILAFCIFSPLLLSDRKRLLPVIVIPFLAVCASALWPYYNVFELLADNNEFQKSNSTMYDKPLHRIYPALLFLPALIWFRRLQINPLIIYSLFLSIIFYILGFVGIQPMMGRIISFVAFLGHFITASSIVIISQLISQTIQKNMRRFLSFSVVGTLILVFVYLPMLSINEKIRFSTTFENGRLDIISARTAHLFIEKTDVILAPFGVGWEIPSLAGKLVASKAGLAFIEDHIERQNDVKTLCNTVTTIPNILYLIEKYSATKLLLPHNCIIARPAQGAPLKLLVKTPRYYVLEVN